MKTDGRRKSENVIDLRGIPDPRVLGEAIYGDRGGKIPRPVEFGARGDAIDPYRPYNYYVPPGGRKRVKETK